MKLTENQISQIQQLMSEKGTEKEQNIQDFLIFNQFIENKIHLYDYEKEDVEMCKVIMLAVQRQASRWMNFLSQEEKEMLIQVADGVLGLGWEDLCKLLIPSYIPDVKTPQYELYELLYKHGSGYSPTPLSYL